MTPQQTTHRKNANTDLVAAIIGKKEVARSELMSQDLRGYFRREK